MKVVIQRVRYARCRIDGEIYSAIDQGFMILVGIREGDSKDEVEKIAKKVNGLRIFEDDQGKMNLDLKTIGGSIMSISQFTLYADCAKGNRPSFIKAMKPEHANELYMYFNKLLQDYGHEVKTGVFGADMKIEMINDGPVTIIIDSEEL